MKKITLDNIIEIVNANIENCKISIEQSEDDIFSSNVDSLAFIHIVVSLEEEFGCEVPDSKLLISEMNTASKIYHVFSSIRPDLAG